MPQPGGWKDTVERTLTTVRCVPRYGYESTGVRIIELDMFASFSAGELYEALRVYFMSRGLEEAIYDVDLDADGWCAIINDEAYEAEWGTPLL